MSSTPQSRRGARPQSLFFRDLSASPATRSSPFKGEGGSTGKSVAAALWRDNLVGSEHPPPPIFSLDDRLERSPDAAFGESPSKSFDSRLEDWKSTPSRSPLFNLGNRTPTVGTPTDAERGQVPLFSSSPFQSLQQYRNPGSPSLFSPMKEGQSPDGLFGRETVKENGSPVSGVMQQQQSAGGLLTLPPIREIVRPEAGFQFIGSSDGQDDVGDEWVTVFGFGPEDTNTVMRELEKCGMILRHVPGPGGANWIHVQFQNKYDAQKALYKNGTQIGGALIIGVKPVDPIQRHALTEKGHRTVFNVLPPKSPVIGGSGSVKASGRSYYLQPSGGSTAAGPIASPSKSVLSKVVDFVFGL